MFTVGKWQKYDVVLRSPNARGERSLQAPSSIRGQQRNEDLQLFARSERHPAQARPEPAGFLDQDRRHPERRLALRERSRDAEAGAGAAAPRARREARSLPRQEGGFRGDRVPQAVAARPVPQPQEGGARQTGREEQGAEHRPLTGYPPAREKAGIAGLFRWWCGNQLGPERAGAAVRRTGSTISTASNATRRPAGASAP